MAGANDGAEFRTVARLEDVPEGGLKGIEIDGTRIVLAESGGEIFALYDECSHEEYALSDGDLEGDQVVCIYHGARFEACSGKNKALPAVRPVKSYPVEVRDGDVYVDVG